MIDYAYPTRACEALFQQVDIPIHSSNKRPFGSSPMATLIQYYTLFLRHLRIMSARLHCLIVCGLCVSTENHTPTAASSWALALINFGPLLTINQ
jgi:hypothetical protein